jgi:diacylglycerol O-acyltransferase / wax synthase
MPANIGLADRIFLLQESNHTPQHVAVLGTFAKPPGITPDYVIGLVASLRAARTFAPPFNYRLRNPGLKAIVPAFVELADDQIDLDFHFRHSAVPQPGGERELDALVSRLHSSPLDMSKPLWEAHLIEGLERNRFGFYFKIHHALIDGVGGARRLEQMLSTDPTDDKLRPLWTTVPHTPTRRREARSLPARVGGLAGGVWSHTRAAAGLGRAAGGLVKDSILPTDEAIATPYRARGTILNGPIGQHRRVATQEFEFDRLHAVADRADVTVNDVFLAVCAGGLRRYILELESLPDSGLTAGTPVSVRVGSGDDAANAFTMATMKLYTQIADPVERLAAIHRSSSRTKRSMQRLAKPVAENFGALFMTPFLAGNLVGLGGRVRPPFNLIVSNVPGPLEPRYLAGSTLEAMYPLGLGYHGMRLFIAGLTVSGTMSIGFVGDRDTLPHLERLAVYTGAAFDELEQALARRRARRRRSLAGRKPSIKPIGART